MTVWLPCTWFSSVTPKPFLSQHDHACTSWILHIIPNLTMTVFMLIIQVFCFIGVFLYIFVAIWEIVFLVKDWNNKVVKYTLKEAITG